MDEIHDGIILGAGCAGLALAREIARTGKALRIAVIEPRRVYEEDRTWCFWTRDRNDLSPDPAAEWGNWAFSVAGGVRKIHTARTWRYVLMRSADYYDHALRAISRCPDIGLHLGTSAGGIVIENAVCRVEAGDQSLRSRWVVDTRPPGEERCRAAPFTQAFCGLELETDVDVFDRSMAVLMGDMRMTRDGFTFDYVLPLSPRRALFEHTVFARASPSAAALTEACRTRVGALYGTSIRCLREELGWIPMGLPLAPDEAGPIIRAGVNGGAVRASSGYAFGRIQRWARDSAMTLARGGMPRPINKDRPLTGFMDRVFLRAMAQHEDRTPDYFLMIARALSGDHFARFMSDEATFLDWLRVVAALPKTDFLAALRSAMIQQQTMRA